MALKQKMLTDDEKKAVMQTTERMSAGVLSLL